MASKPDSTDTKTSEPAQNKSLEITSILNGLQGNVHWLSNSLCDYFINIREENPVYNKVL